MRQSNAQTRLATLARADNQVVMGPVGYAALQDELSEAYDALSKADAAVLVGLEPELLALIEAGSPAAIVYAALLLRRIDRHDPSELLRKYAQDDRPCTVFPGGCGALPMNSLSEAVRWVCGVPWVEPGQRARDCLGRVATAQWFELPKSELLERMRRSTVTNHDRAGVPSWTVAFAELLAAPNCAPELSARRAMIESQLQSDLPAVCVYAALLLRSIDRRSGEEALDTLARSGMTVKRAPSLFGLVRRSTPIEVLVRELRDWPASDV